MCAAKTGIADNFPAAPTENNGFSIGDIVWARNGMFPYWPGRIHEFVKENKKGGASIVWYGDNTYTPFIEFSRIERFAESYDTRFVKKVILLYITWKRTSYFGHRQNAIKIHSFGIIFNVELFHITCFIGRIHTYTVMFRFNPMRPDLKYHKAVANAIISCLPNRGYFEKKLSSQVHEVLMKEKIDLGEVNIIAKCKKRTSSGSSSRRRLRSVFFFYKSWD